MTRRWLATVILLGIAPWLQAAESSSVSFDGFGTLGVVHTDLDHADFPGDVLDPDGAGHTREWSPEVDSRLGLQWTANPGGRISGVLQVIVEQQHDDNYTPAIEWANVRYEPAHDFSVRAGRVVLPIFLTTEFRKVGFALPWVRPPPEVYGLVPVTHLDGIDLSYRSDLGEFTNTLRVSYGVAEEDSPGAGEVEAEGSFILSNQLERGSTTVSATYSRSRLTFEQFEPLFDRFRSLGPDGEEVADRFGVDDRLSQIATVGVRYDPGRWFAMGEWAHTENDSFLADSRAWYVTSGYRIGAFTPYATIADIDAHSPTSHPGVSGAGTDNIVLNALLGSAVQQERIAVGTRWDFMPGAAAKLQFDYIDLDSDSSGVLINEQRDQFERGGTVRVLSASVDFVF